MIIHKLETFNKVKIILFIIFFQINLFLLIAQDYTEYYKLVNRAYVSKGLNDLRKADSLYRKAFSINIGFRDDYSRALLNNYHLSKNIDENLLIQSIKVGMPWTDVKDDLKEMGVTNLSPYKKLYRKNKYKKSVNGFPIMRLMMRDQCARTNFFRFFVRKDADSINAVKLQKLLVKKPELFNRSKTSWLCSELLSVLLIHQDRWSNAQKLFFQVRELEKQGKILHSTPLMVDRMSLYEGTLFKVDSITGELMVKEHGHQVICGPFHYSAIYGQAGRLYDRENNRVLLPPCSPNLTVTEINALRNYLFLLDVEEAFPKEKYSFLTAEEYCSRMKFK